MSEELKILKRSYLTIAKGPLKDSMLSAKRWCVLVKDLTTGSTRMDFFRDEKASTKGEQCRNSLNVASVVEAQRVTEKKQTFELLCPGVSHRFQANSEAEADDWVSDIKSLIVYRKDTSPPARSFSLPTPNLHQPYNPHANLPTPPDTNGYLTSPPIPVNLHKRPTYLRSSSTDSPQHPFPSPNSSGDSSSLNSASTGSMEIHSRFMLASEGGETKLPYKGIRVRVKDSDKLPISGDCDLAVENDVINLYKPGQNVLVASWHIGALRRYGVNKVCFTIDVGRNSSTGPSKFYFYTPQSSLIYSDVHKVAQRIEAMCREDTTSTPQRTQSHGDMGGSGITNTSAVYSRLNYSIHSGCGSLQSGCGSPQSGSSLMQNGSTAYYHGVISDSNLKSTSTPSIEDASLSKPPVCTPRAGPTSAPLLPVNNPASSSPSLKHQAQQDPLTPEVPKKAAHQTEEDAVPPPLPPKPVSYWAEDEIIAMHTNVESLMEPPPRVRRSPWEGDVNVFL